MFEEGGLVGRPRGRAVTMGVGPILLALSVLFSAAAAPSSPPGAEECLGCHADGAGAPNPRLELLAGSRHRAVACRSCHSDVKELPHPDKLKKVDCSSCHKEPAKNLAECVHAKAIGTGREACLKCHGAHDVRNPRTLGLKLCSKCHEGPAAEYAASVHGRSRSNGDADAATCVSCHGGAHKIKRVKDHSSSVYPLNLPETCAKCHADPEMARRHGIASSDMYKLYLDSTHGRAAKKSGLLVSANCSSCHGHHDIRSPKDPASHVHRTNVADTCGRCHAGIEDVFKTSVHGGSKTGAAAVCTDCHKSHQIGRIEGDRWKLGLVGDCGGCHEKLLERYRHTYHGKVTRLGYAQTAKCSDCHGSHDILPASDPRSAVHPSNKAKTCGKCHEGATDSFSTYISHPDEHEEGGFPVLFWTAAGFKALLLGTFLFWGLHTFLWLVRSSLEKREPKPRAEGGKVYWRFQRYHRILHVFIVVSFLGLAATGLPLKFADQPWAAWLSHLFGGFRVAAGIHRLCALITFAYAAAHLWFLFRGFVAKRDWSFLWGKDSLVPQPKDLFELVDHLKYFAGLAPRPKFGRWTYWEKFDYWAVFWGITIIGGTGLVLWFPVFFAYVLPGWAVNVATIIHSDEALLAVGFIFTVHFFNTHLRPEKFPLDEVIFTGRLSKEELLEDKPGQYEELESSGKLAGLEAPPTPLWLKAFARLFGFTAVAIGVILIILMTLWH